MLISVASDLFDSLFKHWGMHLFMLKDHVRLDAYQKAITRAVRRGDVVVDIGSGTGILAFLAARAGAKKVYAIEKGDVISLGRQIARRNHLDEIVEFIHGDSRSIEIPEKADILLSELIGIFALHENMLSILADAKYRFLKPCGKIIPSKINLFVIPIEDALTFDNTSLQTDELYGLDFSAIDNLKRDAIFATDLRAPTIRRLSDQTLFCSIDSHSAFQSLISNRIKICVNQTGTLHGFGGWWEAFLYENVLLSTSPTHPRHPTSWLDAFFPVQEPFAVHDGDVIIFECRTEICEGNIHWDYRIELDQS